MSGPIKFVFTIIWFAIGLGIAGNLIEATGIMGREAAKAHIHGGMSFGWWNRQLVNGELKERIHSTQPKGRRLVE